MLDIFATSVWNPADARRLADALADVHRLTGGLCTTRVPTFLSCTQNGACTALALSPPDTPRSFPTRVFRTPQGVDADHLLAFDLAHAPARTGHQTLAYNHATATAGTLLARAWWALFPSMRDDLRLLLMPTTDDGLRMLCVHAPLHSGGDDQPLHADLAPLPLHDTVERLWAIAARAPTTPLDPTPHVGATLQPMHVGTMEDATELFHLFGCNARWAAGAPRPVPSHHGASKPHAATPTGWTLEHRDRAAILLEQELSPLKDLLESTHVSFRFALHATPTTPTFAFVDGLSFPKTHQTHMAAGLRALARRMKTLLPCLFDAQARRRTPKPAFVWCAKKDRDRRLGLFLEAAGMHIPLDLDDADSLVAGWGDAGPLRWAVSGSDAGATYTFLFPGATAEEAARRALDTGQAMQAPCLDALAHGDRFVLPSGWHPLVDGAVHVHPLLPLPSLPKKVPHG